MNVDYENSNGISGPMECSTREERKGTNYTSFVMKGFFLFLVLLTFSRFISIGSDPEVSSVFSVPVWGPDENLKMEVFLGNGNSGDNMNTLKVEFPFTMGKFGSFSYSFDIPEHLLDANIVVMLKITNDKGVFYRKQYPLIHYSVPRALKQGNLLYLSEQSGIEIPHIYPSLNLMIVTENHRIDLNRISRKSFLDDFTFYSRLVHFPIILSVDFWNLKEKSVPIHEFGQRPFTINFELASFYKYTWMSHLTSVSLAQESGPLEKEFDDIKRMFLESSPLLIAITFLVSVLHIIFDFLAFKNDVAFWKGRETLEGISIRSIAANCVGQFIIFLYLMNQGSSWIVLGSVGIGLLIEIWKVKKSVTIQFSFSRFIPRISLNYAKSCDSRTNSFDQTAMQYLFFLCLPLLFGYSVYSLLYETHKDWYAWILNTLVGFVYAFGFILMMPQLFINYKLKSVAHMPWRSFMYKALNTFVDDLFAFAIKMPILHRIACFRDDVLFVVYLYQLWIYPVDESRINEFGQRQTEKTKKQ